MQPIWGHKISSLYHYYHYHHHLREDICCRCHSSLNYGVKYCHQSVQRERFWSQQLAVRLQKANFMGAPPRPGLQFSDQRIGHVHACIMRVMWVRFPGSCLYARHFITLASSMDRDVSGIYAMLQLSYFNVGWFHSSTKNSFHLNGHTEREGLHQRDEWLVHFLYWDYEMMDLLSVTCRTVNTPW